MRRRLFRIPLLSAPLPLALALLGYVALARFFAQQLVMTGIVLVVAWLVYLAIRAVTRDPQHLHPVGDILETRFGLDAPRRSQLARLTEAALTLALVTSPSWTAQPAPADDDVLRRLATTTTAKACQLAEAKSFPGMPPSQSACMLETE